MVIENINVDAHDHRVSTFIAWIQNTTPLMLIG